MSHCKTFNLPSHERVIYLFTDLEAETFKRVEGRMQKQEMALFKNLNNAIIF